MQSQSLESSLCHFPEGQDGKAFLPGLVFQNSFFNIYLGQGVILFIWFDSIVRTTCAYFFCILDHLKILKEKKAIINYKGSMLPWPTVLVHSGLRSLLWCRTFGAKIRLFSVVGTELRANPGPSLYQLYALKLLNSMSLFALICKIRVKNTYLIGQLQTLKKCMYLGYLSLCSKYFSYVYFYKCLCLFNGEPE